MSAMSCCKKMHETQQYIIDRFAEIGIKAKRGTKENLDSNKVSDSMIIGESYCPYCNAKLN
jgi:hypothetical protein